MQQQNEWQIEQTVQVDFRYPVIFTSYAMDPRRDLLVRTMNRPGEHRRHRVIVFWDEGLARAYPAYEELIKSYFDQHSDSLILVADPFPVPGGESAKNQRDAFERIIDALGHTEYKLCRQSYVLAIGGGSMLDVVGFAASLVHRGMRLIRMPSTVLAQNDAGVGIKNGVNRFGQKNYLGTFAPPFAVINDFSLLRTLPNDHWRGGIAEAFKVAVIKDRHFFDQLCNDAESLKKREPEPMETLIRRCAELHLNHICEGGDPFETGTARPLDFGHWAAHRLEILSKHALGHGQAVAIGVALDCCYAFRLGFVSEGERGTVLRGLHRAGLPVYSEWLETKTAEGTLSILRGLDDFQEHLGGQLTITLPDGLGQSKDVHEMDVTRIEQSIADLKACSEAIHAS